MLRWAIPHDEASMNLSSDCEFKGLAVITVLKAGFLGSGRFGSGIVIARLSDGSWSAPSAIVTGGAGFGGQIGFELTDFVFILNDASAVRTFSQKGSLTLGGNVSIAAGPVGRNAEAAGAASLKSVAGVFSYSKTKGLFAGVSLEGSAIIERSDANAKFYNSRITARQLLEGGVRPPDAAEPLMRVLNSKVFSGAASSSNDMYNDIPIYDDRHDNVVWEGRTGAGYNQNVRSNRTGSVGADNDYEYRDAPRRANTWADDVYDRQPNFEASRSRTNTVSSFGDSAGKPSRPTAPKPQFKPKPSAASLEKDQAIALYTFDADQPGDLGFKKGEIITITKKTENASDWWTGKIGNRSGIFPRSAVHWAWLLTDADISTVIMSRLFKVGLWCNIDTKRCILVIVTFSEGVGVERVFKHYFFGPKPTDYLDET